jgi:hypothetical protein
LPKEKKMSASIFVIREDSTGEIISWLNTDSNDSDLASEESGVVMSVKLLDSDLLVPSTHTFLHIAMNAFKQGVEWARKNPGKEIK